eukprot:XP_027328272.1 uroplakin-3b [Anas platyrhynchos]
MTLETAAAAYACSVPGPVLRVGGDAACGGQHGQTACNGPLPSPGPYRPWHSHELGSPCPWLTAVPPALLPYEPRVPPGALLGKVTATTFVLERPCCVFHRLANASDTVWLVVAFANASATFRNPPSRADVPLYEGLPTTHAYMTLETAAAAYACSVPGPVLHELGSPCPWLTAVPPALLPYEPRVPPGALLGKVTATTFVLERPCCVFHRLANASDTVWLVVAFANASATFRNPPSRADVPLYEGLPTTHAYMTLETAAAAYACSVPGPVLRVGGDAACGGQHGQTACNGPLPSPGPYRVKFLVMGCHGPKAETRWSDPILLRRARSPSTVDPAPTQRSSDVVVIASILASLGAGLAVAALGAVGYEG